MLFPIVARSPQVSRANCVLMCAILYRGLGHLWVLGTGVGVLEPSPLRYQGQLKVWGSQKLCRVFLGGWGSAPLTLALFKGQLHFTRN